MQTQCPKCKQIYETEDAAAGNWVTCPECGEKWIVQPSEAAIPKMSQQELLGNLHETVVVAIWDSVKKFIRANLKAPMTAIFEEDEKREAIVYLGGNCFEINSMVDSQNSYGALVRNYFTAIIFYGENGILPVLIKFQEQSNIHEINPKEIHCHWCRKNFFHDTAFEPETLLCPFCGIETTYIDMSSTGCLKKIILAIIVVPILLLIGYGIICFFMI